MSFDLSKLSSTFAQIDAAKKQLDFGGLGGMSAALDAANRVGADLERMNTFGVGADPAGVSSFGPPPPPPGVRGAALGSLAFGAGLDGTTGVGTSAAKLTSLGEGLSALAGRSDRGLLSAATELAKPPSWTEEPSWMRSVSGVLGAAEKATKPGILDGLGGADRWRGFGISASLAGADRDLWALDSARRSLDTSHELPSFGRPGTLGDYGRGWTGAASFYGAGGLSGAGGSGILDGLIEPFEGIAEITRKAFGLAELLKPYWDGWTRIAEEAIRTAQRIAAQPARPGDELLAFAAYDALEAMQEGRHWVAARFLEQTLNLRATPERLEALWIFLKRGFERPISSPPLWLTLEGRKARAYLATAVYRGGRRIERKRQMDDDIWGKARNPDGKKELVRPGSDWLGYASDQATDDLADSGLDPARLAESGTYDRDLILDELMATGTPVDREIVGLIRTGQYDRADIRNTVGSTRLQAFERKVQRRTQNERNQPRGG